MTNGLNDIDWMLITGVATSATAVFAFFLSWWQARQTLRHNRLSVTPHLVFVSRKDSTSGVVEVILKNSGIGPAIVKESRLRLGPEVQEYKNSDDLERIVWKTLIDRKVPNVVSVTTGSVGNETYFAEGELFRVLSVFCKDRPASREWMDSVVNAFEGYEIQIVYESVYGKRFLCKM